MEQGPTQRLPKSLSSQGNRYNWKNMLSAIETAITIEGHRVGETETIEDKLTCIEKWNSI